ncbi:MAG: hypothetical protein KBT47_03295 [Armatimonadetes bacterium]|nr:hypothetical protein [Candidatus Hippobium faecium]
MKKYLKGALHVHSTMSDSLGTPQLAVDTYHRCGYDFMFFTDHKTNFDIDSQVADKYDMLVMGGVELDCGKDPKPGYDFNKEPKEDWVHRLGDNRLINEFGDPAIPHINALGVYGTNIKFDLFDGQTGKTLENAIDAINKENGIPMICHPNWYFCPSFRELLDIKRDFLLEIGNNDESTCFGSFSKESMETVWDILLSKGRRVFATATDDTHHYFKTKEEPWTDYDLGCVYVWAEKNEESIKEALRRGDFYASGGVELLEYNVTEKGISVKVKEEEGVKYCIMFKGKMGIPLRYVYGTEADYEFQGIPDEEYVRVKVVSNKVKSSFWFTSNGVYNQACYTQPVFRMGN